MGYAAEYLIPSLSDVLATIALTHSVTYLFRGVNGETLDLQFPNSPSPPLTSSANAVRHISQYVQNSPPAVVMVIKLHSHWTWSESHSTHNFLLHQSAHPCHNAFRSSFRVLHLRSFCTTVNPQSPSLHHPHPNHSQAHTGYDQMWKWCLMPFYDQRQRRSGSG